MATAKAKRAQPAAPPSLRGIARGTVLGGKWRIGDRLGQGACAIVYNVEPVSAADASFPIVAKVVSAPPPAASKKKKPTQEAAIADTLYYESVLYNTVLMSFENAPRVPLRCYGEEGGFRYLIMEKLGSDLESATTRFRGNPSAVADIGLQILNALEQFHTAKHLFVDIKPANFMLGAGSNANRVYLVDFGLAQKYVTYAGVHKEFKTQALEGTPDYASIFMHEGGTPSRRDDIISLGYVLLFLLVGPLPWHGATSNEDSLRKKKNANLREFVGSIGGGQALCDLVERAQELGFEEQPQYEEYKRLLGQLSRASSSAASSAKTSKAKTAATSKAAKRSKPSPPQDDEEEVVEVKPTTRRAEPKKRAAQERTTSAKRHQSARAAKIVEEEEDEEEEEVIENSDSASDTEEASNGDESDENVDVNIAPKASGRNKPRAAAPATTTTTTAPVRANKRVQAAAEVVEVPRPTTKARRVPRQQPPATPIREYKDDSNDDIFLDAIDEEVASLDLTAAEPTRVGPLHCGLVLRCINGPHEGEVFAIPRSDTIQIGRNPVSKMRQQLSANTGLASARDIDIVLDRDEYCSENHLSVRFVKKSNNLRIRELGSSNGTKVMYRSNESETLSVKGETASIGVGDSIRTGDTILLVVPEAI